MSQQGFNFEKADKLQLELTMYERDGIRLKLNGDLSTPYQIAKACRIAEDGSYMRDYIENERGEWIELDFDWINEKYLNEQ